MILRAGVAALLLAAGATGQESGRVYLPWSDVLPADAGLEARFLATPSSRRAGGYGWLRIELFNPDTAPHEVAAYVEPSWSSSRRRFRASRSLTVRANGSEVIVLPIAMTGERFSVRVEVDGYEVRRTRQSFSTRVGSNGPCVLVLADEAGQSLATRAEIERNLGPKKTARVRRRPGRSSRRASNQSILDRRPADLPDRWSLLTGFDLIVADGRSAGWTAGRQQLVSRYLAAGGRVLVVYARSLRDGALRSLIGQRAGQKAVAGSHGFGQWLSVPDEATEVVALATWLRGPNGPRAHGSFAGPAPDYMFVHAAIPGLGRVPVLAFFFVVLGFAFVVGPANIFWFKRRLGRPAWLLVSVPLAGLGFTAVILVYGFFSEGFGIKGSLQSISMLDQRAHEVVTHASRTVYAGLSPKEIRPASGTYLTSIDITTAPRYTARSFDVDLDRGGAVAGSALPSRTPTNFVSTTVAPARERLRFRRLLDGRLEALAGPGLEPVLERGGLLLRDFDGRYYSARADGRLRRLPAQVAGKDLDALYTWLGAMPRAWEQRNRVRKPSASGGVAAWLRHRFGLTLTPGSYVGRFRAVAPIDDLGLTVDWKSERHIVVGLLAPEDVVD